MSSSCCYEKCDGSGLMQMLNESTGEFKVQYCKCREEKIYSDRLRFANIPAEFESLTVNSFNTNLYKKEGSKAISQNAKTMVANYVKSFSKFEELGKGIYFYSKTKGSGKTRLAVSLGNVLLKNLKQQVKFITCSDLLKEIKNTYNKDSKYSESQLVDSINKVNILIIDDIGVERPTNWVNEMLFSVLDNRMKYNKITIFTSNCAVEELEHDERLKSRLTKMCIPVKMPEEDIRKFLAYKENESLQDMLLKKV
ncbi:ATP-binding protein [Clostridium estertheticum]|uniref:ATP-binding protein n=1 Tax=Clostridium estertheticum TaxID=238834 RepID=UPI0013EEC862|nr:DnaA/Hda family protein [Clostridium estertheticum]MBZ9608662.1 ATP-binding protein [Clostridium estertheticum]